MPQRPFFATKLGKAAIASVFAMTVFIALSSQIAMSPMPVTAMSHALVELA